MVYGKVPPTGERPRRSRARCHYAWKIRIIDTVIEILKPECFYVEAHQRIYRAMQSLKANKSQWSISFYCCRRIENKRRTGNGGSGACTTLPNLPMPLYSAAHIWSTCAYHSPKFIQRELIRISGEIIGDAYEDSTDVFDLLDDAESKFFEITNNHLRKEFRYHRFGIGKNYSTVSKTFGHKNEEVTGVPSGFTHLDKITYGWQNTRSYHSRFARPAVGKTAFALEPCTQCCHAPNQTNRCCLVLPWDECCVSWYNVSSLLESEIWLEKIASWQTRRTRNKTTLCTRYPRSWHKPRFFIDDTLRIEYIWIACKMPSLKKISTTSVWSSLTISQLMSAEPAESRSTNREQEISNISRNLKGLRQRIERTRSSHCRSWAVRLNNVALKKEAAYLN